MSPVSNRNKSIFVINNLSAQSFDLFLRDFNNGDKGVQLFLGIFVVIPLTSNSYPNSPWNTPDSLTPDELVQLHINPHIIGSHSLLSKLPDLLNRFRSLLLKCAILHKMKKNKN